MKVSTELFRDDVQELSEKAKIGKTGHLIQFLYHRSRGLPRTDIEGLIGVSRKTLYTWETKLDNELNTVERSELVAKAVIVEHDKRFNKGSDEQ